VTLSRLKSKSIFVAPFTFSFGLYHDIPVLFLFAQNRTAGLPEGKLKSSSEPSRSSEDRDSATAYSFPGSSVPQTGWILAGISIHFIKSSLD
jgi:hypothetical protein